MNLTGEEIDHYVYSERLTNKAYNMTRENINLLMKNGAVVDVSEASDNLNISALTDPVEKYFLCYPMFKSPKTKQLNMIQELS
jgi:3-polyprenyl-4-hydroxybenzoate decarboxylase